MKVERIDLFDFKVTLTEAEFNDILASTNEFHFGIEDVLRVIIELGFKEFFEDT